ncbi:MAG TPA: acyltransferase [Agriterribacter sp.]|nr:acyltransferase [Chitinophagaceae bacterium]HRP31147.1 acyltransferase [Agriterribacter sp.]
MQAQLTYFRSLNGLRWIAALMVIVSHFFSLGRSIDSVLLNRIVKFGNSGVSLFFVLSGFVITRILINSINQKDYFKVFYMRRVLRIFPLYYFALLCYYFLPFIFNALYHFTSTFSQHIYYYTYLQNFALTFKWKSSGPIHFWSLAVEEHFYLIWPALVFFVFRYAHQWVLFVFGILVLGTIGIRVYMLSAGYTIDYATFTRMDQLVMGGILAVLESRNLMNKKHGNSYVAALIGGAIFFVICIFLDSFYQDLFKHSALGLMYFGIIALCAIYERQGMITRLLKNKIVQYLGTISYGIYVWHALALDMVNQYLATKIIIFDFVLVVLLTVAVSSFSYWFMEKRFLNLKRNFSFGGKN